MISTILYSLLILLVDVVACYIAYLYYTQNVKQEITREIETHWKEKSNHLDNWEKHLKLQHAQMDRDSIHERNILSQKKSEATQEYEKDCKAIKAAEKIRNDAYLKINGLEKRVSQLQSELHHARKRAERLANKAKNTVQISP